METIGNKVKRRERKRSKVKGMEGKGRVMGECVIRNARERKKRESVKIGEEEGIGEEKY